MATGKRIIGTVKFQIKGGMANPSPPIGPALGQYGADIAGFCKAFNNKTQDQVRTIIPVIITIYADRSFSFITKMPPASQLLKQTAGIQRGSGEPNKETAGEITRRQLEEIARIKWEDLNAHSLEAACRTIAGTARSMGIKIVDPPY